MLNLAKHFKIMELREEEIYRLIENLSRHTNGFENPKIIMIGGYALRAFTTFSRYTRDCDFLLKKPNGWNLDKIQKMLPKDLSTETFEKRDDYGFLRCVRLLKINGRSAKISIDFMEGEVRGRTEEQRFFITNDFMQRTRKVKISIAEKEIKIFVPNYIDYLILKIMSARPSDIRDIATLVWKNGIPDNLEDKAKKVLAHPDILKKSLKIIIEDISNKRFVDSWKGTFVTTEFTEETKEKVLKELKKLL
ncbi:MAG: nucleotidyl transferase AbiEii/AbiGii toxin family protein [Candidatus Bathyarchaeota archaeon]